MFDNFALNISDILYEHVTVGSFGLTNVLTNISRTSDVATGVK